jgi:hypothetical protein
VRVSEALSIFAKIFVRIDGALQDFASDVHRYVPGPALRGVEASTFGAVAFGEMANTAFTKLRSVSVFSGSPLGST